MAGDKDGDEPLDLDDIEARSEHLMFGSIRRADVKALVARVRYLEGVIAELDEAGEELSKALAEAADIVR